MPPHFTCPGFGPRSELAGAAFLPLPVEGAAEGSLFPRAGGWGAVLAEVILFRATAWITGWTWPDGPGKEGNPVPVSPGVI